MKVWSISLLLLLLLLCTAAVAKKDVLVVDKESHVNQSMLRVRLLFPIHISWSIGQVLSSSYVF